MWVTVIFKVRLYVVSTSCLNSRKALLLEKACFDLCWLKFCEVKIQMFVMV